jgi:uncharacterized repeat protein (TIGR04076 family)
LSFSDVKITVLKKLKTDEVFEKYANKSGGMTPECTAMKDGVEYVSKRMAMPEGFCSWAWADIQRDVIHLGLGGEFPWVKEKGVMISACTDGLRPVVFKLERVPAK